MIFSLKAIALAGWMIFSPGLLALPRGAEPIRCSDVLTLSPGHSEIREKLLRMTDDPAQFLRKIHSLNPYTSDLTRASLSLNAYKEMAKKIMDEAGKKWSHERKAFEDLLLMVLPSASIYAYAKYRSFFPYLAPFKAGRYLNDLNAFREILTYPLASGIEQPQLVEPPKFHGYFEETLKQLERWSYYLPAAAPEFPYMVTRMSTQVFIWQKAYDGRARYVNMVTGILGEKILRKEELNLELHASMSHAENHMSVLFSMIFEGEKLHRLMVRALDVCKEMEERGLDVKVQRGILEMLERSMSTSLETIPLMRESLSNIELQAAAYATFRPPSPKFLPAEQLAKLDLTRQATLSPATIEQFFTWASRNRREERGDYYIRNADAWLEDFEKHAELWCDVALEILRALYRMMARDYDGRDITALNFHLDRLAQMMGFAEMFLATINEIEGVRSSRSLRDADEIEIQPQLAPLKARIARTIGDFYSVKQKAEEFRNKHTRGGR